jgi:O-antigen biosynthesis protein WbqP
MILAAIITKCTSKGPVLFKQERIGRNGKPFKILKFRSMRVDAPEIGAEGMTVEEQQRMCTRWGRFMRKTSIDEFPQLLNILVGQMPFIGPRPGMVDNQEYLTEERQSYVPSPLLVRPGLSGYSQIYLHREHDPKKKAMMDSHYVENIHFGMDTRIFCRSLLAIFGLWGR